MKMTRRDFLKLSSAAAAACGVTLLPAQKADAASAIQTLLEEAYLYAFPLVLVDATKTVSTNTKTASASRAPVNQFIHARKLLDASSRTVVSPNVDTIYTQAWLDVSAEPQIYVVPETDRFFNVQVLDAWTNTAAVLEAPGAYAIAYSGWEGTLPEGVRRIDVPTRTVWTIARIMLSGPDGASGPDAADAPLGLPRRAGRRAGGQLFPGKRFRPGGKSPRHDAAGVFRHRQPADGDRPARRGGRAPSPQPRGPLRRPGRAVRRLRPRPPRRAALEADAPSAQEQPPGAGRTLCPADGPVDLLRRPHRRFRHGLRLPHHGGPDGPWGQHHRRRHLPAHLHRQHRGRPHRQKDLYPPLRRPAAHGGHRILVGDGLRRGQLPHR